MGRKWNHPLVQLVSGQVENQHRRGVRQAQQPSDVFNGTLWSERGREWRCDGKVVVCMGCGRILPSIQSG